MKNNLKEFIPLWKLIKEEKKKIIISSLLIFLIGILEVFFGYLNGLAVEEITNLHLKRAIIVLGIYFVLDTIDSIVHTYCTGALEEVESKLTRKLGFETYKKSLNLPAVSYEEKSSGEIINRITNDADTLSFIFGQLLRIITNIVACLVILVFIFYNSWIVGLEICFFLVLLFFTMKKYGPLMKDAHKARKVGQDKFSSLVNESIRGVREIKTLGIKKNLIKDMRNIIKDVYEKSIIEIKYRKSYHMTNRLLKSLMEVGVFITCLILLYFKMTTLTFFIAMTYYVYKFMYLIEDLSDFNKSYQRMVVSLGRINEILENRLYDDVKFGEVELNYPKGVIEFKNVTFGYPNEGTLLNDFNIKIEPNKKIAVVGASGQGKSTLFNLLTRIFDANEGVISLDGVNICDLSEDSLRKNISVIRQEPFIFNRSIIDNFRLVDQDIDLETVRKYTKMAYLDDYIMSLPEQYNTILGESGVNLSGGQKQRLSIARTLAKNSKVILFDEATSALDNKSQEFIKKSIDNLVLDHTVIIVAHRLSTIIDADIIYVVDKGQVSEKGTHKELLKKSKIYKNLYETESLNS